MMLLCMSIYICSEFTANMCLGCSLAAVLQGVAIVMVKGEITIHFYDMGLGIETLQYNYYRDIKWLS